MNRLMATVVAALAALLVAAPASAATGEAWNIVFVIYRQVDATCHGAPVRATVSDSELAAMRREAAAAVNTLNRWNKHLNVTGTVVVRDTLTSLTESSNGECWVTPADIPSAGSYSTHYILVDPANSLTGDWWLAALGISYVCGSCAYGGTWAVSAGTGYSTEAHLTEVIIHEWLHGAAAWYRDRGYFVPDVHRDDEYGFTGDPMTWYRALVAGKVADRNGDGYPDGITRRAITVAGAPN